MILLSVLGCFGNILAFIGFQREKTKTATTFLFQCLAIADTSFLFLFASCVCSDAILQCADESYSRFYRCNRQAYLYFSCDPPMYMLHLCSVWITVFLGVIRFVAVCYPMHFTNAFTTEKVKRVCLIGVASFAVFEAFWYVKKTKDFDTNGTCFVSGSSNNMAKNIYIFGFTSVIHYFIPLCSLSFITLRIIHALRTRNNNDTGMRRQTMNRNTKRNMNITKILVIILMIFLICNTCYFIQFSLFLLNVVGDIGDKVLFFASRSLLVVNSGINVIVYTGFNKHYRKRMLMQLCNKNEITDNRTITAPKTETTSVYCHPRQHIS